jgi:superfamily I DNA/RNA helicase
MPDAEALIPDVTDDDIEWVCALMGLDLFDEPRREFLKCPTTVDLSACPGSGKTTLIVAKLAILAKNWPYRTRGICVLSHTNVAREQIERRLGQTVVGQRLLSYPHFIDTIHGFVNRFLALPWLYSNGYPVDVIDDEITLIRRWFKLEHSTHSVLEQNRYDKGLLKIIEGDFSLGDIRWGKGILGRDTKTYQALVSCQY